MAAGETRLLGLGWEVEARPPAPARWLVEQPVAAGEIRLLGLAWEVEVRRPLASVEARRPLE